MLCVGRGRGLCERKDAEYLITSSRYMVSNLGYHKISSGIRLTQCVSIQRTFHETLAVAVVQNRYNSYEYSSTATLVRRTAVSCFMFSFIFLI